MRRLPVVAILVFFSLLPGISLAQAQTPPAQLLITYKDESKFPEVTIGFRALGAEGKPILALDPASIILTEDNQPVTTNSTPIPSNEGGLWVHFVIDAGIRMSQGERWPKTKEGILNFTELMGPDDHVAVTVIQVEEAVSLTGGYTTDPVAISDALDAFTPPCNNSDCASRPLPALGNILGNFDLEDSNNNPKLIFLFSGALERGNAADADNLIDQALNVQIPIYTILVDGRDNTQPLVDLGNQSGGTVTFYEDINSLNATYRQVVESYRRQYSVTYRSTSNSAASRVVRIATPDGLTFDDIEYSVTLSAPRISIQSPEDGDDITCDSADLTQEVLARAIFTDATAPRTLNQATLLVDGVPVDAESAITDNQVVFAWKPCEEEREEATLTVEATDELGFTGQTPLEGAVTVSFISAVPSPTITVTTTETITPSITITPAVDNTQTITTFVSQNGILIASILLVLVAVAVVVFGRNRGPVKSVRETVMKGIDRLTRRYARQTETKAYLIVKEGDSSVGKHLEIFGTTSIGRSKQDAELIFQAQDETSPISRRHCTILDEEDHFAIRDEDSANGTYVNGVRLTPLVTKELQDGDEIELARVERGGVKLEFQSVQPSSDTLSSEFRSTRATRAVRIDKQKPGDRF